MITNVFYSLIDMVKNFRVLFISFLFFICAYFVQLSIAMIPLQGVDYLGISVSSYIITLFKQNFASLALVIFLIFITLLLSSLGASYYINRYLIDKHHKSRGMFEGSFRLMFASLFLYILILSIMIFSLIVFNKVLLMIFILVLIVSILLLVPRLLFLPVSIIVNNKISAAFKDSFNRTSSIYFTSALSILIYYIAFELLLYTLSYLSSSWFSFLNYRLLIEEIILLFLYFIFIYSFLTFILLSYENKM